MIDLSVILPIRNTLPAYIGECIESILSQSYSNFELLIVDDSTERASINAIDSFSYDHRVIIFRRERSTGLPSALNLAIQNSKGQFIARVDADDIQHRDRFITQIKHLERHQNIGVLGASIYKIDKNGILCGHKTYPMTHADIKKMSSLLNPIAHPTVMMRRSLIGNALFYDTKFLGAEDYELWMRLLKQGVIFENLSDKLIFYRNPVIAGRDLKNWLFNLKIKIKYFSFSDFLLKIFGIIFVLVMIASPRLLKKYIYKTYNYTK